MIHLIRKRVKDKDKGIHHQRHLIKLSFLSRGCMKKRRCYVVLRLSDVARRPRSLIYSPVRRGRI